MSEFLRLLEVDTYGNSGVNVVFSCPFHGDDRHPSARMNHRTTAWLCSACGAKGNAVHFLARLRNIDEEEALSWIRFQFGIADGVADVAPDELGRIVRLNLAGRELPQMITVPPHESWVSYMVQSLQVDADGLRAFAYMKHRGFTQESIFDWEIGYDSISKRVAIPVRDVDGRLVGFKARAIDSNTYPRYLVLGDTRVFGARYRYGFHPYSKSEHVFDLHRVESGAVVVVEGELNAIAVTQKTGLPAVGVAGSEFSKRQRDLIASRCSDVVVFFDDDNAGRRGTAKVARDLIPFVSVRCVWRAPADAAELTGPEIQQLVDDAQPAARLHALGEFSLTRVGAI